MEADFLIHKGGRFALLEAKFTESPSAKEAAPLEKVGSILGEKNVDELGIMARPKDSFPLTKKVKVISVRDLWLTPPD